jgi:hypothetical protein
VPLEVQSFATPDFSRLRYSRGLRCNPPAKGNTDMTLTCFRLSLVALILAAAFPALAEGLAISASSAGSSASSAGSASLRGSSDSISGSSDSSRADEKVAEGEYRVTAVQAVTGQADMLRLTMEPLASRPGVAGFKLDLPQRALGDRPLTPGATVSARHRPYGVEFARGDTRDAFFLVLADDWHRDLQTRVVSN